MATHNLFKGIKRVLATNTVYTATTNNDYLYFVRTATTDLEGDIWFQGVHYGHFGEHDLDAINTALAGFIGTGATTNKDVKSYIDDEIAKLSSGMTTSVDVVQGSFSGLTIADDSSTANVKDYKVSLINVAPADELAAEIAARKAVDGQNGQTYVADANAEYIDNATSLSDADSKLDAAIKALADKTITENGSVENYVSISVTTSSTGTQIAIDDTALANKIAGMDLSEVYEAGKAIVAVKEEDGVVTATAGTVDAQYVDIADAGSLIQATNVEGALQELAGKINANEITNADGSINVTTGQNSTDVNVNIKSGEHVLAKDGNAGLYTDLDFVKITTGLPETVKERYQLLATDNSQIGVNIDVPKDSHIVSINYITTGEHAQNLEYVYIDASGQTQTTYVDMSELVLETEFASGVTVTNHIAHGVVDPASEKDSNNDSFLTVGADGFKVDGIKDEIDAKIAALDKTDDAAVAGQYVAAIEETDGVVAVKTRANVSEAVLNNYVKGTDATAVADTDTVNQAISKLENQVDKAKSAATTVVAEGTDAGNNMDIAESTDATDGHKIFTVNLTDVASKTALDAEIAARKAVDGQNGDTYAANTGANYISGATSLNDADIKLDTALKAVADQVEGLDYAGVTDENTKVVTDVKQENGLVSASATSVGDLVITAVTTADTKVAANDNLATIAGKLQGQIDAMDLAVVSGTGAAIVSVSEADGKVSATTGNVDTDHVVLASALTGSAVTANAGAQESTVLQQIVNAIDNLGGNALTGVTSTGNTLAPTVANNVANVEFVKEAKSDATVADGHLELNQNANHEWYGVMYWIDDEN